MIPYITPYTILYFMFSWSILQADIKPDGLVDNGLRQASRLEKRQNASWQVVPYYEAGCRLECSGLKTAQWIEICCEIVAPTAPANV